MIMRKLRACLLETLLCSLPFVGRIAGVQVCYGYSENATSVRAASDAVLTGYEKPADQSENVKKQRAGYGDGYYRKYAGGAVAPAIKSCTVCARAGKMQQASWERLKNWKTQRTPAKRGIQSMTGTERRYTVSRQQRNCRIKCRLTLTTLE